MRYAKEAILSSLNIVNNHHILVIKISTKGLLILTILRESVPFRYITKRSAIYVDKY